LRGARRRLWSLSYRILPLVSALVSLRQIQWILRSVDIYIKQRGVLINLSYLIFYFSEVNNLSSPASTKLIF
jgi:hypothetical protein